jgi:DnaJ family protein B protein 12
MPGATASGAETNAGASARPREHNQGNQDRSYTVEQKAAVLRIRRCSPTSFYDILGLESVKLTVTDTEIKKAYRKLSLLTHPDKNGHEHADEAFKMVSRAFGVLGDKEKREKFDRFGTDPDSRFASAQAQNPFSGFGSRQASGGGGGGGMGGGGMWQDEMSPEEMFQRFFGGGGFGGPFGGEYIVPRCDLEQLLTRFPSLRYGSPVRIQLRRRAGYPGASIRRPAAEEATTGWRSWGAKQ